MRVLRLAVATSLKLRLNPLAHQRCYLEVHAAKLNDVANSDRLRLMLGAEITQDLVNTALFANYQPHSPFKVDVVFLIFLCELRVLSLHYLVSDN